MEMDVAIAVTTDFDEDFFPPGRPDGIDALILLGAILVGVIFSWATTRILRR